MVGYKSNSRILVALLYRNDKKTDKEIMEIASFPIGLNNIKYLGVDLTKQLKNLHDKNHKF